MPIRLEEAVQIIFVVSIITMFTRAIPFVVFGRKKEIPKNIRYLGNVLPMAVMGVLVVYCVKGVQVTTYPYALPELIAIVAVVVLHVWKRNNLLSIGAGTILYMFLIQVAFSVS